MPRVNCHETHRHGDTHQLANGVTHPAAGKHQRHAEIVGHLLARGLLGGVPAATVSDLMRQHAGEFGLALGAQEQAGALTNRKPPGSAKAFTSFESITLTVKGTRASELRTRFCDRRFTYSATTGSSSIRRLPLDLGRHLPAQFNFPLERVDVDAPAGLSSSPEA